MRYQGIRYPRTFQEIRAVYAAKEEGIQVRAKRTHKKLPDSFNDIPRSTDSSWKNNSKCRKQYMKHF